VRLTVIIVTLAGAVAAWAADGGRPAAFALLAGDGRAQAMGGAGVALDGIDALDYNVAALAAVERNALASSWRALSLGRRLAGVSYGRRVLTDSGIGASWTNAAAGEIISRSDSGVAGPAIKNSQNMFVFGFGRPVAWPWLQAGLGGRFYYLLLDEASATGFGVDLGVRASLWEWLTVAAAAHDLGTSIQWDTINAQDEKVTEKVPVRGIVGAAVRPWPKFTLTGQADVGQGEDVRFHGGAEYWLDERVALRAGLNGSQPTLGAAVVLPRGGWSVGFDYGWTEEAFSGEAAHTATLALLF